MKKRLFHLLMALCVGTAMLAGCGGDNRNSGDNGSGNGGQTSEPGDSVEGPGEIETVKMYLPAGNVPTDLDTVLGAINEISREKIGVELDMQIFEFGQWSQIKSWNNHCAESYPP